MKCNSCGARYTYSLDKLDEYGAVECQNCGVKIFVDSLHGGTGVAYPDNDVILQSKETSRVSTEGTKIKCPNCLARYIYKEHQISANNTVQCQNCGMIIEAVGEDVIIYGGSTKSESNSGNGVLICLIVVIFLFVPWIFAIPAILCIICFKGISENKSDEGERKIVRRDGQGPSVR